MIRALPDLLSSSMFSRVTSELRTELDRSALEAVTGQKLDITAATGGRNGQIHRAQLAISDSQATQTRLALMTGRFTQAAAAFTSVRSTVSDIPSASMQAVTSGSAAGIETMARTAESAMGVVFSAMNTRFDGRALFGGDAASANPFGNVQDFRNGVNTVLAGATTTADKRAALDGFFAAGGGFETSTYKGGLEAAATAVLPNGFELSELPRADSDSFRDLLKGLAMVATAREFPPVEMVDWVRQGADLVRSAQEALTSDEAEIGLSLNRIDQAAERERDDLLVARETLDRIIGRDTFEAASETQNLEIRLQAAYTLSSRLSQLTLTDYIR